MRRATLTILGLYQWDPTIFDDMQLPAAIDRNTLIGNIVLECAGLEITLPNAEIFKSMLTTWSNSRIDAWSKMVTALQSQYNALHNYDRTETHTDKWSNDSTKNMVQSSGGSDTTTTKTAAFDGDSLATAGENKTAYGGTANTTNTDKDSGTRDYTIKAYGNIGVTTSQQMLESEMQLRGKYDIYSIIVSEFRNKFCILIY